MKNFAIKLSILHLFSKNAELRSNNLIEFSVSEIFRILVTSKVINRITDFR